MPIVDAPDFINHLDNHLLLYHQQAGLDRQYVHRTCRHPAWSVISSGATGNHDTDDMVCDAVTVTNT